jgi:hypothetical protein
MKPWTNSTALTSKLLKDITGMLVYGDPQFEIESGELIRRLAAFLHNSEQANLDDCRDLLVPAGQFEQAAADHLEKSGEWPLWSQPVQGITDTAARIFVSRFDGQNEKSPVAQLSDLSNFPACILNVKIPEGFAFYSLFPEQYVVAARAWAHSIATQQAGRVGTAFIVGLRSIGTTLSAVVMAALRMIGWDVQRITVRPRGDPFSRTVELPKISKTFDYALVVDEGPGMSGSSMAAACQALLQGGFSEKQVIFFPGHDKDPGPAASVTVRSCWERLPRAYAPLSTLRWSGAGLKDILVKETERLLSNPVVEIQDLSAGAWRKHLFPAGEDWPAIAPNFERMKFRIMCENREAVLWKFAGLGLSPRGEATILSEQMRRQYFLAQAGYTPPALKGAGFLALPWINGHALTAADFDDVWERIVDYLVIAAREPLGKAKQEHAFSRLKEILYWNTQKDFGDDLAQELKCFSATLEHPWNLPAYGDGRMAPHEWIRSNGGTIFKADSCSHDFDHTIVGEQSILWDVAAVFVEWNLNPIERERFLSRIADRLGIKVNSALARFYELSYAAFKLGLFTYALEGAHGIPDEEQRLKKALTRCREILSRM